MIIELTTDGAAVVAADDCTRLHVATGLAPDEVDAALRRSGIGSLDAGGRAVLDLDVLHDRAAAAATTRDWGERWQAMVDYARAEGWVSADDRFVRAHVESTAPATRR
ncbi:hypothetical protein SAMN05216207_103828 [Pseudonocardia ammonioxydans]|uniref:Uncharacterized protein n=1 Tax=Pseudonocardia ammonioxydans TaxID=260086 RepID=A0A1I5FHL7_PSUAM|nr:hypothetical protein [Pseudonocardia ammonioxydans]SFO23308.1 hypothetical protein SAMN05216207_103828 [Pseudonocardia ammonioxydans]